MKKKKEMSVFQFHLAMLFMCSITILTCIFGDSLEFGIGMGLAFSPIIIISICEIIKSKQCI
jgi:hypothetical protein